MRKIYVCMYVYVFLYQKTDNKKIFLIITNNILENKKLLLENY